MSENIKEKIKKVYALSENGATEGEKLAAANQLNLLLDKYNLQIADLIDEEKQYFSFFPKTKIEKQLLFQIYGSVVNDSQIRYRTWNREIIFSLTKIQNAEISFLFSEHKSALKKHLDKAFLAYIYTNDLTSKSGNKTQASELTDEEKREMREVVEMMMVTKKTALNRKRLEN